MAKAQVMPRHKDLYKSMFNDGRHSDITIKVGDESLKLHKLVLMRASQWFEKAFDSTFKVRPLGFSPYDVTNLRQEADAKHMELPDDDPRAAKAMLRYLYGLQYWDDDAGYWNSLNAHALVYSVAEKYCLESLKTCASEKMRSTLNMNTPVKDVTAALATIWRSTPTDDKGARPFLSTYCVKHMETCLAEPTFLQLIHDTELGGDLLVLSASTKPGHVTMKLETCACGYPFQPMSAAHANFLPVSRYCDSCATYTPISSHESQLWHRDAEEKA